MLTDAESFLCSAIILLIALSVYFYCCWRFEKVLSEKTSKALKKEIDSLKQVIQQHIETIDCKNDSINKLIDCIHQNEN